MNKDALLATVIGFGIGLVITGILLVGPLISKSLPRLNLPKFALNQSKQSSAPTASPTPSPLGITVSAPLPESIENEKDLLVSGTTTPGALVVIQGVNDDSVVQVKEDGKFAGKLTLSEGKNDVSITSYLKDKQSAQALTVYYTPEEF